MSVAHQLQQVTSLLWHLQKCAHGACIQHHCKCVSLYPATALWNAVCSTKDDKLASQTVHELTKGWVNLVQDLLSSILTVMGLSASAVTNADTLSRLGIDSMQMVEVSPHQMPAR